MMVRSDTLLVIMPELIEKMMNHWMASLTILLLLAAIIIAVIAYIVSEVSTSRFKASLKEQSSSVRIFIIDGEKNEVTFFNIANLRDVRTQTMGEFYQKFPLAEQKKVIGWINALFDGEEGTPDFLEANVSDNSVRKQYSSMLQVSAIDRKKKRIHLQSFLLKGINSRKGDSDLNRGTSTTKEFAAAIASNSKRRGVTVVYRFAYKKISDSNKEIDPILYKQLQNALSPLAGGKRQLVRFSGNELILSDLRVAEKEKAILFASEGLMSLNRYLSINGLNNKISLNAGVLMHRDMDTQDAEAIIQTARGMAKEAADSEQKILVYRRGHLADSSFSDSSYRSEVERIISEKKLIYLFRPIWSTVENKIMGYFLQVQPDDSAFSDIAELKEYATGSGDDRALFATIAKTVVPRFVSERGDPSQKLFFRVRTEERGYMLQVFSRISNTKDSHTIFLFDEVDIRGRFDPTNPDALITDMKAIKAKGFEVGLFLNSGELLLANQLYSAFDYFVCGFSFTGAASNMDASIRSKLHALVEKLLKYDKPIIATDAVDWPSIEILVRSGLNYISSDVFAPYDEIPKPASLKAIKKIQEFKK